LFRRGATAGTTIANMHAAIAHPTFELVTALRSSGNMRARLFAATASALSGPGSRGFGSARPTGAAGRSAFDGRKMPASAAFGMPGRGSESFKLGFRPMARASASAASGPFTAALTVLFTRSVTAWLTGRAFGTPRETIS
jgi:hypothetical protein